MMTRDQERVGQGSQEWEMGDRRRRSGASPMSIQREGGRRAMFDTALYLWSGHHWERDRENLFLHAQLNELCARWRSLFREDTDRVKGKRQGWDDGRWKMDDGRE